MGEGREGKREVEKTFRGIFVEGEPERRESSGEQTGLTGTKQPGSEKREPAFLGGVRR